MGNFGEMMMGGFLPTVPDFDDFMSSLSKKDDKKAGWAGLSMTAAGEAMQSSRISASDDLKRCYVQLAETPAGRKVIQDLLNFTLRRTCSHPDPTVGIEQEAMFARERRGQNSVVVYMLSMIEAGRKLPDPASEKSEKSKRKTK